MKGVVKRKEEEEEEEKKDPFRNEYRAYMYLAMLDTMNENT